MAVDIQFPKSGGAKVPTLPLRRFRGESVKASTVKLNGLAWPMKSPLVWGYASGTQPQVQFIPMLREYADKFIDEITTDVTLSLTGKDYFSDDLIEQEYSKLQLIMRPPGDYNHDVVMLTDDRWRWAKRLVTKCYNLTRKSTDRLVFSRTTAGGSQSLIEAVRYFVPFTVIQDQAGRPVRPWKALDIVLDVLVNILGYPAEAINTDRAADSEYVPLNQDIVGMEADSVVRRFLDMSDNELYIENDGSLVIYANRRPVTQENLDALFPNGFPGLREGNLFVVDRSATRPTQIDGFMEPEIEMLCTYTEADTPSRTTTSLQQVDGEAALRVQYTTMRNVTVTVVDNQVPGLPRGSVVDIHDAIAAFGQRFGTRQITFAEFRRAYGLRTHTDVYQTMLGQSGQTDVQTGLRVIDTEAMTAFGQMLTDFRSLFQISPQVMDRVRDVQPLLVDVVNPAEGTRQKSEVFSTVTWFYNESARQNLAANRLRAAVMDSFRNPASGQQRDHYVPVNADLQVDKTLGLVRVNFLPNLNEPGVVNNILRGRALNRQVEGDAAGENQILTDAGQVRGVESGWECSFILSMIPRTPNSMARLQFMRSRRPEAIAEGVGPKVEIFIGDDTARFALRPSNPIVRKYLSPNREDVVTGWVNERICRALSQQECVRRWYLHADQAQGGLAVSWAEDSLNIRPVGTIADVRHSIGPRGAARVSLSADRLNEPPDIRNLLPEDILRATYRQLRFNEPPQGGARG